MRYELKELKITSTKFIKNLDEFDSYGGLHEKLRKKINLHESLLDKYTDFETKAGNYIEF